MVIKLTVSSEMTDEEAGKVMNDFHNETGIILHNHFIGESSSCGKFEYLYIFLDEEFINKLVNVMLENSVTIYKSENFTKSLIDIFTSNKLEEFRQTFPEQESTLNNILEEFVSENITQDMILEKITNFGISSLKESDYLILNK